MAKKRKGLFGIGSIESDAWKIGKGTVGAVVFDMVMHRAMGHHGGHHEGGGEGGEGREGGGEPGRGGGSDSSGNPMVQGIMSGIEDMTGMKGHPVLMAAAGLLVMQTEYREFGEGMAYIGAYNAITSHRHVRAWGGGMHGIGAHDILAAIEEGVATKVKELKAENQDSLLAGGEEMYGENEYEELFSKKMQAA